MECLQQPTFTKKNSNLQKLSFAKFGPRVQNCEIKWLSVKISTIEILVGAIIMFWVTCSLVLHTCSKLVLWWWILSTTEILFLALRGKQVHVYSVVTGVSGYGPQQQLCSLLCIQWDMCVFVFGLKFFNEGCFLFSKS